MVRRLLLDAEGVLRGHPWVLERGEHASRRLAVLLVISGLGYGAVMGSYGGWMNGPQLQVVYSATKVPLLLLLTFCICLPSFFVVNTLLGLRDDFRQVIRALAAGQTAIAIILLSLSPLTAFWYASNARYDHAILFNLCMFTVASLSGQFVLRRNYRELIQRRPRHSKLLWCWIVMYGFVGIQMGWVLRPFIGDPLEGVQFLRPEAWDNAYIILLRLIGRAIL